MGVEAASSSVETDHCRVDRLVLSAPLIRGEYVRSFAGFRRRYFRAVGEEPVLFSGSASSTMGSPRVTLDDRVGVVDRLVRDDDVGAGWSVRTEGDTSGVLASLSLVERRDTCEEAAIRGGMGGDEAIALVLFDSGRSVWLT